MKYLLLFLFAFSVQASPFFGDDGEQGIQGDTGATGLTGASGSDGINYSGDYVAGTAAAMSAAGLQFDMANNKLQFGVSAGMYRSRKGDKAFGGSIGLGKALMIGNTRSLVSGSVTTTRGNAYGANVSATFAF